jgi:3-oxoacyl-[acyl-carrier-protein] synthase-3
VLTDELFTNKSLFEKPSPSSRFEGFGGYLPAAVRTTSDLVRELQLSSPLPVQAVTGVAQRRVYDPRPEAGEDSFGLALRAARDALDKSRYTAADIDVVICACIIRIKDGDDLYFEPSFAGMLARELGAEHALHFDVSNACAGMMTGVYLVDRMIRAGLVRTGLVVSAEQATRIAQTASRELTGVRDPQFASLSVGDSAAAVVLDRSVDEADRIHYVEMMTCAGYTDLCFGMPSERSEGLAMYTASGRMQHEDRIRTWAAYHRDRLAERGSTFGGEGFDYVIHHQVSTRVIGKLNAVGAEVLGSAMPASLSVVEKYGNCASTSHFVTLREHLRAGTARQGSKFLLVPAASGLVFGVLSATISNLGV